MHNNHPRLPTEQILLTDGTDDIELYTPTVTSNDAAREVVANGIASDPALVLGK